MSVRTDPNAPWPATCPLMVTRASADGKSAGQSDPGLHGLRSGLPCHAGSRPSAIRGVAPRHAYFTDGRRLPFCALRANEIPPHTTSPTAASEGGTCAVGTRSSSLVVTDSPSRQTAGQTRERTHHGSMVRGCLRRGASRLSQRPCRCLPPGGRVAGGGRDGDVTLVAVTTRELPGQGPAAALPALPGRITPLRLLAPTLAGRSLYVHLTVHLATCMMIPVY